MLNLEFLLQDVQIYGKKNDSDDLRHFGLKLNC